MPVKELIRSWRELRGLSQDDLATRLRRWWPTCDKTHISKIENGVRKVKADELPWFAAALECRLEDLVDRIEKKN